MPTMSMSALGIKRTSLNPSPIPLMTQSGHSKALCAPKTFQGALSNGKMSFQSFFMLITIFSLPRPLSAAP